MIDMSLEVDIKARWQGIPSYRIWVDNELMCERSFWVDPETFIIREMIYVVLEPGDHILRLEQIDQSMGKVWMDRVIIRNENKQQNGVIGCGVPSHEQFQNITFQA